MWTTFIAALPGILVGIAACIPLCVNLVKTVKSLVMEKRWSSLMQMVADLMVIAEDKLAYGADKKEWVLAMLKSSAEELGYDYDEIVIGEMIDCLAAMAKTVNSGDSKEEEK